GMQFSALCPSKDQPGIRRGHLKPGFGVGPVAGPKGMRQVSDRIFRRTRGRDVLKTSSPRPSPPEGLDSDVARGSSPASKAGVSPPSNMLRGGTPLQLAGEDARATLEVSLRHLLQICLLGLLLLLCCFRAAAADLYAEAFDDGNKLYAQGKFAEAA